MDPSKIDPGEVRFFCGSSNRPLASRIAQYLGVPLDPTHVSHFSNTNLYIQLGASVRGRRVYIVQTLSQPADEHLMELLMMLDIARGASAREIHAIIPYFSYARSDKKDAPRISITARLVADLLETAGATHAMSMMLHSPQVHGFFSIPVDPLSSRPVLEHHFRGRDLSDTVIRDCRRALLYDDEIATGGSVYEISQLLIQAGIKEIWVACTHGVFSKGGLERLAAVPQITEIVTTDTVYLPEHRRHPKLQTVSVARVFGEAIRRNYMHRSIGDLFVFGEEVAE